MRLLADKNSMGKTNDVYAITLFDFDGNLKNLYFHINLYSRKTEQYTENTTWNTIENHEVLALVDTGATICGISKRMIKKMKLEPLREDEICFVKGNTESSIYILDVIFPKGKVFENIEAVEINDPDRLRMPHDFIIGMNILRQGDVAITSVNGKIAFSFRIPPAEKYIDFELQDI